MTLEYFYVQMVNFVLFLLIGSLSTSISPDGKRYVVDNGGSLAKSK